ncbi:hypothetical protein FisN_20Lh056 [Fistulifera solaris]|uniref:DDHD domain-containing protein n=1 Tax=Fistulifera solaris TaxID=1519565 RepID=A0A1Z5JD07_FISSO|nr:hypothetical protein FisN_20Lh056 [Fistulifera solaris]|eukprot:GAX11885.1 hypothetical protein FisN_20Lh056 [Fistulifera solaris]
MNNDHHHHHHPPKLPASPRDDAILISPFVPYRYLPKKKKKSTHPLWRVQRVGRHAAMTTKQVVWDSNDASIEAALSAVDQWEAAYTALRGLSVACFKSARGIYSATKDGTGKIEHGFFLPVRDWIILPAFSGAEQVALGIIGFFQSDGAIHLGVQTLDLAKQVPFVGENFLVPALCFTVGFVHRSWEIAQYPIPSRQKVRDTVDFALNGTKWALSTMFRELCLYVKRADANITRTLSHTQWKVLGSGPYATLDSMIKKDVIDHICDRYFSLTDPVARYELAAHIRFHNRPLYDDLVLTGVLKQRGSSLTEDDEWLCPYPNYRALEDPFLVGSGDTYDLDEVTGGPEISPLWFRLPYINGRHPGKDAAWICCRNQEQKDLEQRYREIVREGRIRYSYHRRRNDGGLEDTKYATIAKWYEPDPLSDVLVDQNRHAVSFRLCCPLCRKELPEQVMAPRQLGDLCPTCCEQEQDKTGPMAAFAPPPLTMIMRPTLWRFYGPGDEVRRSNWFLDTARGLQPFGDEAQALLEDAYLFLNWMNLRRAFDHNMEIDGALLTVEVPNLGEGTVLVQFSSLTYATVIQKGLGAAIAMFKRRVYRGAWLEKDRTLLSESAPRSITESILQAVEESGTLGETMVPDVSIRSVLAPPPTKSETGFVLTTNQESPFASLAVPTKRLYENDMAKNLVDHKVQDTDHLILIVHGIGEMMQSMDVFGLSLPNLSSIVDCCGFLRKNHVEIEEVRSSLSQAGEKKGRVEYLPVEWHEAFSIVSQRRAASTESATDSGKTRKNVMLNDISLKTIPQMREFANDTLMDVLYFMSPEHHDIIVDVVANEMNVVVEKFRELTGFKGDISLIGHSLGSIISWDILSNQRCEHLQVNDESLLVEQKNESSESLDSLLQYGSPLSQMSQTSELSYDPSNEPVDYSYPQLDFSVDNFFLLGSPVAVFLMIRNQRAPLTESFYLKGCRRVFNIFHPYDPVAYRLEPCIDPRNSEYDPMIMAHWNGGLRVQYQTKRLWRMFVDSTWQTQQNFLAAFEAKVVGMGLMDSSLAQHCDDDLESAFSSDDPSSTGVKSGALNQGRRIDYMLQEKEIESANEYVAALAAHSSYWIEKDLSMFIARQITLGATEKAAANEWESVV